MKPSPGDVKTKIYEAIGESSMCWHPRPTKEVFDSNHAAKIAQNLFDYLATNGFFDN